VAKLKTLIIGLDGATFDLILPWVRQGHLPGLESFMKQGAWGELQTVFPPITAAAWSSFITAKNPGKHGIYDFLYREPGKYTTAPNNRLTRNTIDFWEIFNQNGLSTGLVNIPMTYPPAKVDGYMLTGIMTPRSADLEHVDYTFPKTLKHEIKEKVGNYSIHPKVPYQKNKAGEVYDHLLTDLDIKIRTIRYLLETKPTELMMFVIGGTDKIQHDLFHLLDPHHPRHDKEEAARDGHLVLDYFKKVDMEVAKLAADFCSSDTLLVVMSDHGFGPIYKWIFLNNWLLRHGYLKLKKHPLTLIKRLLFKTGVTPGNIYKVLMKFGFSKSNVSFEKRDRWITRFFLSWNDIDWLRTRAYSQGHVGQVYINKQGREPSGIVSGREYRAVKKDIENKLLEFYDGDINVVEKVLDREEIYRGPFKDRGPDILFIPHRLEYMALGTSGFISNRVLEPAFGNSGNHRMNGIFIMSGKGIKNDLNVTNARIEDVVPNILFYNNLAVDEDMDGRVLEEIYEPAFFKSKSVEYMRYETKSAARGRDGSYSEEEAETVKEALRGLGYLG
jgi:predicted AlkP superfamily phosphohydrolase/phosphomutase